MTHVHTRTGRRWLGQVVGALALAWAMGAGAQPAVMGGSAAQSPAWPPGVLQALQRAGVPTDAVSVVVADSAPGGRLWWQHRPEAQVNPASTMKLVTTLAALDVLGPAHVWRTTVWTDAPVVQGVLQGHLYLRGEGDPKLVTEKLWWLLRRVQGLGIERIAGDIVLDRSAYQVPDTDPGAFDGEPLRPYNATPDAWLINFKAQQFQFVPDPLAGVAHVSMEPPLAGVQPPRSVPLLSGPCTDWRSALRADWSDPLQPRFLGGYPLSCGERTWPLAHPEPAVFAERAVAGMWQHLGGQIDGRVRAGLVPTAATVRLTLESPPLAEVVRDVNKFSNNVMAQHVLLALSPAGQPASFPAAHQALAQWWQRRMGPHPLPQVHNGAGLSRDERTSALALAHVLQVAYVSPFMPDFLASLPLSGHDGTLRRSALGAGLAHLKTGSLRDVQALAGYVHGPHGQRRVLVAIVNHPQARAARPALDALVQWAAGPLP